LFSTTYKTPFHFEAGTTPQDDLSSVIALAVILRLKIKSFISANPLLKLQEFLDSGRFSIANANLPLTVHMLRVHQQIKITKSFDWLSSSLNFHFASYFNFVACPENHSQNVDTSEQSIGRQEPLNCQCEGLLVSNKSEFYFLHIHCFTFENHLALLKP